MKFPVSSGNQIQRRRRRRPVTMKRDTAINAAQTDETSGNNNNVCRPVDLRDIIRSRLTVDKSL